MYNKRKAKLTENRDQNPEKKVLGEKTCRNLALYLCKEKYFKKNVASGLHWQKY